MTTKTITDTDQEPHSENRNTRADELIAKLNSVLGATEEKLTDMEKELAEKHDKIAHEIEGIKKEADSDLDELLKETEK